MQQSMCQLLAEQPSLKAVNNRQEKAFMSICVCVFVCFYLRCVHLIEHYDG